MSALPVPPVEVKWELLNDGCAGSLERTPVPGGWLVRQTDDVLHQFVDHRGLESGYAWHSSLCFVPDPTHSWGA